MPLARLVAPFDHPDWIFEPKLDGFRALAYVENGAARLVSRKGNTFKSFPALTAAVAATLPGLDAVLDGEVVHLGPDGAPRFYDLMRRRSPQHFYVVDLLWLDGRDLRGLPLIERKAVLRALVPAQPSPVLYVDHVAGTGTALFQAVCDRDMEGIVAKLAYGTYTPDETTWVKIKNPNYSQAEGRAESFEGRTLRRQLREQIATLQSARFPGIVLPGVEHPLRVIEPRSTPVCLESRPRSPGRTRFPAGCRREAGS
jgi:ATP-dependent DNA ligase